MPGIVSLLDDDHAEQVVAVRRRLADELGVETPVENHYPHVSYQVADAYDDEGLRRAVADLAAETGPFTIRTNGVGVFTDSEPLVVYLPVVRDAALSRFHRRVWERAADLGTGLQNYYRPDRWTPHVTVAPVERADLGAVVDLLSEYAFYWEVEVDDLATIQGEAPDRRVEHRRPLTGDGPPR